MPRSLKEGNLKPTSHLAQVRLADLRVLAQLLGGGGVDDGAGLQDVAAGGDLEGDVRVLLDEEDGGALGVDLLDDVEDALDEDGSQAHRGLVEEEQLGAAHQGASDGEHLLLAPAHRAGLLLYALLQAGEELEDAVHVPADAVAVVAVVGAHLQVLADRHAREDLAPLRALGYALLYHVVGGDVLDLLAVEDHLPLAGRQDAVYGAQRRSLPGAVRADQGDDLALLDREGDAAQ